jgi:hypothetical protein
MSRLNDRNMLTIYNFVGGVVLEKEMGGIKDGMKKRHNGFDPGNDDVRH